MLPWIGLSIDDVASVMNLTSVYGIGNIILVLAAPTPHCLTKIKIELKGSNKNAG